METASNRSIHTIPDATEATPASAYKRACVAILWVSGTLDEQRQQDLIETLQQQDGIAAARFATNKANLIMVDYKRERTNVVNILNSIRRPGIRARQVGC